MQREAISAYFSANPALSMLALARHHPVAGSVEAGQAVLANFQGSGFIGHYLLMGVAGVLISVAVLRSAVFSRTTAVAGLLQGAMMLVPSTLGTVGLIFALGSLAPFIVWFMLIGLRLLRLAREANRRTPGALAAACGDGSERGELMARKMAAKRMLINTGTDNRYAAPRRGRKIQGVRRRRSLAGSGSTPEGQDHEQTRTRR